MLLHHKVVFQHLSVHQDLHPHHWVGGGDSAEREEHRSRHSGEVRGQGQRRSGVRLPEVPASLIRRRDVLERYLISFHNPDSISNPDDNCLQTNTGGGWACKLSISPKAIKSEHHAIGIVVIRDKGVCVFLVDVTRKHADPSRPTIPGG